MDTGRPGTAGGGRAGRGVRRRRKGRGRGLGGLPGAVSHVPAGAAGPPRRVPEDRGGPPARGRAGSAPNAPSEHTPGARAVHTVPLTMGPSLRGVGLWKSLVCARVSGPRLRRSRAAPSRYPKKPAYQLPVARSWL
ncbi:hypothetical protein GCM10010295_12520 [Streptomyces intermedius]